MYKTNQRERERESRGQGAYPPGDTMHGESLVNVDAVSLVVVVSCRLDDTTPTRGICCLAHEAQNIRIACVGRCSLRRHAPAFSVHLDLGPAVQDPLAWGAL